MTECSLGCQLLQREIYLSNEEDRDIEKNPTWETFYSV